MYQNHMATDQVEKMYFVLGAANEDFRLVIVKYFCIYEEWFIQTYLT